MRSAGANGTGYLFQHTRDPASKLNLRESPVLKIPLGRCHRRWWQPHPEMELLRSLQQQVSKLASYDTRRMEAEEAMLLRMKREQGQLQADSNDNRTAACGSSATAHCGCAVHRPDGATAEAARKEHGLCVKPVLRMQPEPEPEPEDGA